MSFKTIIRLRESIREGSGYTWWSDYYY